MVYMQPIIQTKDSEAVHIQSKDSKSLQKTKTDFASLQTLPENATKEFQGPWQTATQ